MSWTARWQGIEYPAAPELRVDGWWVWLTVHGASPGFEPLTDEGPWVREVRVTDCETVVHRRTVARWRGLPCVVVGERPGELLLQDTGGAPARALDLGFTAVAPGVRRRWTVRDEVEDRRVEELPVSS